MAKRYQIGWVVVLVCICYTAWADNTRLIIEHVTCIDGTGRQAIKDVSVLVQGEHIAEIKRGSFSQAQIKDAQIINGRGKYLIPGLIDVHVHLVGSVKVAKGGLRKASPDPKKGKRALAGYLYSGVTSIYDSGNVPNYIFSLRKQERAGKIDSPRLFATGGIVTYPGSHGSAIGATLVTDWPEAIPMLDKHINMQPDMLKLTLEDRGWGMRPAIPILPLPLMVKIVEYYNDHGIRVTVHAASEVRAREAISTGVDALSHPVITGPVSTKFVKFMAAKKIPMATTLTIGENYSRLAEKPDFLDQSLYQAILPEKEIEQLKTVTRKKYQEDNWTWWMKLMTPVAQENIRRLNESGAVLALGTDQSNGAAVHREMELLVAAGIPTLEVIKMATLNGAKFLGKEDSFGSITEGKLADMVLLEANPITDINNAKKIHSVIKGGQIINRSGLNLPVNE